MWMAILAMAYEHGGLEFPGHQRIFWNGLGCAWGKCTSPQEKELVHTGLSAPFDDVGLDGEVVVQKVRGLGAVRTNPTHLAGLAHLKGLVAKNACTALWSRRSIFGGPKHEVAMPASRNARTKADPTMPVWPAT